LALTRPRPGSGPPGVAGGAPANAPEAGALPAPGGSFRPGRTRWVGWAAGFLLAALACPSLRAAYDRNSEGGEGWYPGVNTARTAREAPWRSAPTPPWTNAVSFGRDVFSFARVRYSRLSRSPTVWWNGGYWYSDYPDSDLNLSYRLQQLTSIKVDPDGRVIDLTDRALFDYPWVYLVEPGLMTLEEAEVTVLRQYLLNGGFLMADDFWGTPQWANFEREMKRVFPERKWRELEMDHRIFHMVYDLAGPKEALQVPNVMIGRRAETTGVTWEFHEREQCRDIHFRALFDDKDRLMVIACYNTDNGDGWEREGEDQYFFRRFCEKTAYPLAINIIVYSMTH
jgi:hypothetical protein